jgi:hypothetical protein
MAMEKIKNNHQKNLETIILNISVAESAKISKPMRKII